MKILGYWFCDHCGKEHTRFTKMYRFGIFRTCQKPDKVA